MNDRISPRTLIVICSIFTFVVVPLAVWGFAATNKESNTLTNTPPPRTEKEISDAIIRTLPHLADKDKKPLFKLLGFRKVANNWHVAWVDDKTLKILIIDSYEGSRQMRVVLGPGSIFNESEAVDRDVPIPVFERFVNEKL